MGIHIIPLTIFIVLLSSIDSAPIPVNPLANPPSNQPSDDYAPIIGFDCNQTEPEILSISTLEIKECPEISALTPTTTSDYGQIIQRHEIESVKIHTCQLTKSTHYFRCGGNWVNYNVYPPSIGVVQSVTPKNCHKVHESGFYLWSYNKEPWGDLVANKTYHFSANEIGWTDSKGYCEGGSVDIAGISYSDIVVQVSYTFSLRESWGHVDYTTGKLNIESVVSCEFKDGSCEDAMTGTHVWTPVSQKCPEDKYRLLYEGKVNITTSKENPTVLLSIQRPPFLFTTELGVTSYTCGLNLQLTEFPNIFYLPRKDGSYQLSLARPGDNDIKFLTYLNSKLTFLYHNLLESSQKMYLSSLLESCKVEREMLRNRIEIIRLNSASGGLSSLLNPGMFAKVNGEIIHLIKCKPVSVKFRNTDKCYDALPIIYDDQPQFLLPNTHIITPYAGGIECSPITPLSYKIGGSWWSFTGTFQRVPEPEILAPTTDFTPKFQKIRTFGKGGMYSQEQVEAVQKLLVFPQLRESITTEFVRGVTKFSPSPMALDMTNIMSETDWKTIARRNLENVWGYFSSIGSAVSGLIGIYFLYRLIKGAIDCIINTHELYKLFGCSLYMLSSIWGRLAQYYINQSRNTTQDTQTSPHSTPEHTQNENNEMIQDQQPGPHMMMLPIDESQRPLLEYMGLLKPTPTAPSSSAETAF